MSNGFAEDEINIGDVKLTNIPSLEDCSNIGFRPTEYNVVVAVATVVEKTKGGIILPESSKDTMEAAYQIGRLVRVSPAAFTYVKEWPSPPPQVGDIVLYARYGGILMKGLDGKQYRMMKDKDINGTYDL